MTNEEAKLLLDKYNLGEASPEEAALLQYWFIHEASSKELEMSEQELMQIVSDMRVSVMTQTKPKIKRLWPRIAGIAAAVAAVVLCIYFFSGKYDTLKPVQGDAVVNDIAPGKNGATVTLANGQVIQLSGEKMGVVIGSELKYSDGSVVRYSSGSQASGPAAPGQKRTGPVGVHSLHPSELQGAEGDGAGLQGADGRALMLTASTAKGQTYQFTLPDGTKVWLNADSKISFPSRFSGKERKILLSGEGYFEVVHNAKMPFRVESSIGNGKGQVVEDIGTAFNINAYGDEASVKTTLVEGIVRVAPLTPSGVDAGAVILKPNQQALWTANHAIKVNQTDTRVMTAWKDGYFRFSRTDLRTLMRQISRWYDIDVVYEDNVANELFNGVINRQSNLSEILDILKKGDVDFDIVNEGGRKRLMVKH